jgi:hypothetical protein
VSTSLPGSAARAVATTTGHPALKLVLLTVAALPGWPAADDVAAHAELDPGWTRDALAELVRVGHLVAHRGGPADADRFSLPEDGWGFASERDGDVLPPDEVPTVNPADTGLYTFTGRKVRR